MAVWVNILRAMLLTLTPNPSLDLLFTADGLVWDDANRVPMPRRRPGGQGVNVVRVARALDPTAASLAVAPLGGAVGEELRQMLAREGTPLKAVPASGETRLFVGVRDLGAGRALLLNPRGPTGGPAVEEALFDAVSAELERPVGPGPHWLACCGSLPPGVAPDFYARVGEAGRQRGWCFVPDCDGEGLRAAAASADLLVPNVHEAERLLGRPVSGLDGAASAARALLELGPALGVITLGAAGAVAATSTGCWRARLEPGEGLDVIRSEIEEGSAVGAGDAFLAALLLNRDPARRTEEALGDAVAAGTAALLSRGSDLVRREDFDRVRPHVRVAPVPGQQP